MTKFPEQFATESGGLPIEVRDAILEVLYYALIFIRANDDNKVCALLADHTHNLTGLLKHQKPVLLADYCEAIPYFRTKMDSLGQKVGAFEPAWKIIQNEYEKFKSQPKAYPSP